MRVDDWMVAVLMFITLGCFLAGVSLMFIGGLALMIVKCAVIGSVLFLCAVGLWVCIEHI